MRGRAWREIENGMFMRGWEIEVWIWVGMA
jgi:hypothetical protein